MRSDLIISFNPPDIVHASDSLEIILSHLSARVMDVIANGNRVERLKYLLKFLAAWKERPACLTPIAYLPSLG